MRFNKQPISIKDQIQLLELRGLNFTDKSFAEHFLAHVSYYRLAGYWWPLQSDKINHTFKANSQFTTVVDLYNFDRELRLIVFNMIERIEIGIRTQLIYNLSTAYGAWWFENKIYFNNQYYWSKHLESIKKEISRSKEVFILEHKKKYAKDNRCPPAWKSLEVISLGLLSKLYGNLKNQVPEKKRIARDLGVGNHTFLTSWLQSISVVRNICAHHSRLWNRNLSTPPKLLKKAPNPFINTKKLDQHSFYAVLCNMQYLLQTISPKNRFRQRIEDLLNDYPNIDIKAMGFPSNWKNEPLWMI